MAIAVALMPLIEAYTASADTLEADMARCMGQPSWLTRVQCYDKTARTHGIEPVRPATAQPGGAPTSDDQVSEDPRSVASSSPTSPTGKWRVETAPAGEAGGQNVWLMLASENAGTNLAGESAQADMALRCMAGSLDVMVWAGGVHYHSAQPISAKLEPGQIEALDWGTSSDAEWAFHPAPRAFIDRMVAADRLYLSLEPADAPLQDFQFDLTGLRSLTPQLEAACPR